MKGKLFDYFTRVAIFSAIILYVWMALSSLDGKYEDKILASSFSISGEAESTSPLIKSNGAADYEVTTYGKAYFVNYVETFHSDALSQEIKKTNAKSKRTIATAYGETDIRYHLRIIKGAWMPTTLDLSTNALYNISYIANTPSKLVHNIKMDLSNSIDLSSLERLTFVIWDILQTISGILVAGVMLIIGSIIGLVFHPIQSVINFFPSLWLMVITMYEAATNIFN